MTTVRSIRDGAFAVVFMATAGLVVAVCANLVLLVGQEIYHNVKGDSACAGPIISADDDWLLDRRRRQPKGDVLQEGIPAVAKER